MSDNPSEQAIALSAETARSGSNPPTEGIEHPGINDVMFGRGGDTNYHIGNHRFRVLADEHREEYRAASRKEKALVVQEVVRLWRARGGRFLTKTDPEKGDESLWHDVGDCVAKKKAAKILSEKAPQERNKDGENKGKSRKRPAVDSVDADVAGKRPFQGAAGAPGTQVLSQILTTTAGVATLLPAGSAQAQPSQPAPVPMPPPAPSAAAQLPSQLPLPSLTPLQASTQQALQRSLGTGLHPNLSIQDLLELHRSNPLLLTALGLPDASRLMNATQSILQQQRVQQQQQGVARNTALLSNALLLNRLTLGQANQLLAPAPATTNPSRSSALLLEAARLEQGIAPTPPPSAAAPLLTSALLEVARLEQGRAPAPAPSLIASRFLLDAMRMDQNPAPTSPALNTILDGARLEQIRALLIQMNEDSNRREDSKSNEDGSSSNNSRGS